MKNDKETHYKANPTKSDGLLKSDSYLVDWYIGVAKRRGWDEVVRLLAQYPNDEERIKMLIKKRLGK
jgi:hypothetical protein